MTAERTETVFEACDLIRHHSERAMSYNADAVIIDRLVSVIENAVRGSRTIQDLRGDIDEIKEMMVKVMEL